GGATRAAVDSDPQPLSPATLATVNEAVQVARSTPHSTVTGLASSGMSTSPPPQIDGSRHRRLIGYTALAFGALAIAVAWTVVHSHMRGTSEENLAGASSAVAPAQTAQVDPTPGGNGNPNNAVAPGKAVIPGNPAPSPSSASQKAVRPKSPAPKASG